MANAALSAWGVKFLAAVLSYNRAVNFYNNKNAAGKGNWDGKRAYTDFNSAVNALLSLRAELVGILSNNSVEPAQSATILPSLDRAFKPATDFLKKQSFNAPSGVASALTQWYNTNIKPLI